MFSDQLPMLRAEGVALFALSILLYAHAGYSWLQFMLLFMLPDIGIAGDWVARSWSNSRKRAAIWR